MVGDVQSNCMGYGLTFVRSSIKRYNPHCIEKTLVVSTILFVPSHIYNYIMSKIIVVFGASGTVGLGFIKATLEKGIDVQQFCYRSPLLDFKIYNNYLMQVVSR